MAAALVHGRVRAHEEKCVAFAEGLARLGAGCVLPEHNSLREEQDVSRRSGQWRPTVRAPTAHRKARVSTFRLISPLFKVVESLAGLRHGGKERSDLRPFVGWGRIEHKAVSRVPEAPTRQSIT